MKLNKKLKCGLKIWEIIVGVIIIIVCLSRLSYLNGYTKGHDVDKALVQDDNR